MPEISVIVPVYNTQSYLRECIDSILEQTFRDFELILIDDGSADGSGGLCDEYAKKDGRVRVLHQQNRGQSAARNNGVAAAKAELLCFIDSDDAVHPALLRSFADAMRASDVGAVTCDRVRASTPPEDFYRTAPGKTELLHIDEDSLLRLLKDNSTVYWTLFPCLIKKEIYQKYPLTPGRVMEDNAVACKWLHTAGSVALIRAPLYFYRENPAGTMNAAFSEKNLDFLWALEEQLAFYGDVGYAKLKNAVASEYVSTSLWLSNRVKTELGDPKLAKHVAKKGLRVYQKYKNGLQLPETERRLFGAAHPTLHRLNKKIKRVFGA